MKTFLLLAATSVFAARVETLSSEVRNPYGLVTGPDGALYICEIDRHVISRLDLKTRKLTIVAGTVNQSGYSGDGGPATAAKLFEPYEIRFDKAGNMFFVEMKNHLIRRVDHKTGIISTVAGQPDPGFGGDNGPATQARFRQPHSIQFDPLGRLVICDIGNNRVRRIDFSTVTRPLAIPMGMPRRPASVIKLGQTSSSISTIAAGWRRFSTRRTTNEKSSGYRKTASSP